MSTIEHARPDQTVEERTQGRKRPFHQRLGTVSHQGMRVYPKPRWPGDVFYVLWLGKEHLPIPANIDIVRQSVVQITVDGQPDETYHQCALSAPVEHFRAWLGDFRCLGLDPGDQKQRAVRLAEIAFRIKTPTTKGK